MATRLFIFIPLTLLSLLISLTLIEENDLGVPWIFMGCSAIGIYAIVQTLLHHYKFKLVDSILVIEAPLKVARRIDLKSLEEWKQFGINIRGQRQETIVLFLENQEKIVITNSEYKSEFTELLDYLSENQSERKQRDA